MDTVKVQMAAAPTSVTLNNVALTASQYTYTAASQSLAVPVAAGQAIDLWINGVVSAVPLYEKPSLLGHLRIRAAHGVLALLVPPAAGLRDNSRIEAGIMDMRGRQVWKSAVAASQICSSTHVIPLSNISTGSYIATVKVDGVNVQRSKIVVP